MAHRERQRYEHHQQNHHWPHASVHGGGEPIRTIGHVGTLVEPGAHTTINEQFRKECGGAVNGVKHDAEHGCGDYYDCDQQDYKIAIAIQIKTPVTAFPNAAAAASASAATAVKRQSGAAV